MNHQTQLWIKHMIALLVSLGLLAFGIWIFLYSDFGMAGLRALAPGAVLPDTIENPSADQYRAIFETMGTEGRRFYIDRIGLIDTVFPFLYTLPMVLAFHLLLRLLQVSVWPARAAAALFFLPALFDLIENACLHALAHAYPLADAMVFRITLGATYAKAFTRDGEFIVLAIAWTAFAAWTAVKRLRRT